MLTVSNAIHIYAPLLPGFELRLRPWFHGFPGVSFIESDISFSFLVKAAFEKLL
jgi:hypothetical protein